MSAPRRPAWPIVPVVVENSSMKLTAPLEWMAELFTAVPAGRSPEMSVPTPPP